MCFACRRISVNIDFHGGRVTYLFQLPFAAFFLLRDQAIPHMLGLSVALFGPYRTLPFPQLRLAGSFEDAPS